MTYPRYLSILAIIAGLFLAAAPWWWPEAVGGGRAWSDAQANEYSQAAAEFHRLAHDTSQGPAADINAAAARYNRNRQALEQARSAGRTAATVMQCLGVTTIFAGLLGYSALQQSAKAG